MSLLELANSYGTDKGDWQGFCPLYEKYLPSRSDVFTLVELGVQEGNSIAMWKAWFESAKIVGVDIDLTKVKYAFTHRVDLVQGDQGDLKLAQALTTYRKPTVVIDDASHDSRKTIDAFNAWWPTIAPGGLYVVEDTHCSYDVEHYGAKSAAPPAPLADPGILAAPRPITTMDFLKRLADDVNWGHHDTERFAPYWEDIAFVHFYPGICFIGKKGL